MNSESQPRHGVDGGKLMSKDIKFTVMVPPIMNLINVIKILRRYGYKVTGWDNGLIATHKKSKVKT